MDVVVKDVLPSCLAVGLGDIQAEQTEPFTQQARNSVDGSHHVAGLVFGEYPDVLSMSPRDDERVATGYLTFVQERDGVLVFVHAPRRQQAFKDFAERAVHRTMIPACGFTGQHNQADSIRGDFRDDARESPNARAQPRRRAIRLKRVGCKRVMPPCRIASDPMTSYALT